MKYPKVVAAALAETQSKFALAEALATEIPPRNQGGSVENDDSVRDLLLAAREEVITKGGEPRTIEVQSKYRKTALWVAKWGRERPNFRWVSGVSFTAHDEARQKGMTFEEFKALGKVKARDIRQTHGAASKDGPPEKVMESWTPEQKRQVVVEALKSDPTVADAVVADSDATKAVFQAGSRTDQARATRAAMTRRQNERDAHADENPPTLTPGLRVLAVLLEMGAFVGSIVDEGDYAYNDESRNTARLIAQSLRFDANRLDAWADGASQPPTEDEFEAEVRALLGGGK